MRDSEDTPVVKALTPPEILEGTMIGDYRVEGVIGEGGWGRVYAAVHPVIAKRAAIKILHANTVEHPIAAERFVQEARAVNQIGHPNIVDIFAFGQMDDGRCYLVMELLRGETLAMRLKRGRLSIGEAIEILDTIAVALAAAHEAGIIHRDLKPDNVYLADVRAAKPAVKLLDFGIAKLVGEEHVKRTGHTETGNLLGTPAYISPEQARGQTVDSATDLYAFGAMTFELMTGRLPYPADNMADMIAMHLTAPPPSARALAPDVPMAIDRLVQRLLAKDPLERPSLAEARGALKLAMQSAATLDQPGASAAMTLDLPATRRRWPWIAVAVIAIGCGIAAILASQHSRPPGPPPAIAKPASPPPAPPPPVTTPVATPIEVPPDAPAAVEAPKPKPPKRVPVKHNPQPDDDDAAM